MSAGAGVASLDHLTEFSRSLCLEARSTGRQSDPPDCRPHIPRPMESPTISSAVDSSSSCASSVTSSGGVAIPLLPLPEKAPMRRDISSTSVLHHAERSAFSSPHQVQSPRGRTDMSQVSAWFVFETWDSVRISDHHPPLISISSLWEVPSMCLSCDVCMRVCMLWYMCAILNE